MPKQDLTNLTEEEQMKRINLYIKQRSFHSDQDKKVCARDLIEKFKHDKFLSGLKRLKFFNVLLVTTVNKYKEVELAYSKLNIVIESINVPNKVNKRKTMKLKRKRY